MNLPRRRDIPALALVLLSTAGFAAAVFTDGGGGAVRGVVADSAVAGVLDGSIAAAIDDAVERAHPFRGIAVSAIAVPRYLLFRQGNDGVVVGRNGWLFTDEEIQVHPGDVARRRRRTAFVVDTVNALAGRGIATVVVAVPSKARVAAHLLPPRFRDIATDGDFPAFVGDLRSAGVAVVDAGGVLRPELFFARDTHWRPDGAGAVAAAVAADVESRGWSSMERAAFTIRRDAPVSFIGDLRSFVPLGAVAGPLGLVDERYRPVTAERMDGDGGGLFDTPAVPVALVGTSYSADGRWGFDAFLKANLRADVLNLAEPGGGPFVPMASYLGGTTIDEVPPQLVVWEIPERYLTLPGALLPSTE